MTGSQAGTAPSCGTHCTTVVAGFVVVAADW